MPVWCRPIDALLLLAGAHQHDRAGAVLGDADLVAREDRDAAPRGHPVAVDVDARPGRCRACCTPGRTRRSCAGARGRTPGSSTRSRAGRRGRPGSAGRCGCGCAATRSALCSSPKSAVVDHLVFLALAQRLDGQPQLLLDLVHRLVVEVGDAAVDPQHGLRDGQLVLARAPARSRRTCRAAPPRRRARTPARCWPRRAGSARPTCPDWNASTCARSVSDRSSSSSNARCGSISTVHAVFALTVYSHMLCGSTSVSSPKWSPLASVSSTVSSPYRPGPILVTLPCAIRNASLDSCPNSTITSPAEYSRCSKPSASAAEHLVVVVPAQQRQLAELRRDHPDSVAVARERHPAVADRVGQPAVDPVGAAGDLHPRQHLQQPPRGDALHLGHGLLRRGQVPRRGRRQALLRPLAVRADTGRHRFRHRHNAHHQSHIVRRYSGQDKEGHCWPETWSGIWRAGDNMKHADDWKLAPATEGHSRPRE